MRIGILSYPMLFQREEGVQRQTRETIRALTALTHSAGQPLRVELVDPHCARLGDYDAIHVFSATHGNHLIVDAAAEQGVPVVLTPLVSCGWDVAAGHSARAGDQRMGSLGQRQSGYAQTRRAMQQASLIVALGEAEKQAIGAGFLIDPEKIRVFPNGISPHLFRAGPELFRLRTGIVGPFALMVAPISPYKNQLGAAQAMGELELPLVIVGEAQERDQASLRQLQALRGVSYLGGLRQDAALLASAYAAASVFVLPSRDELMPLAALEALAAGTPAVISSDSALCLEEAGFALARVAWDDGTALKRAVAALLAQAPPRSSVRALVRGYTWDKVAARIAACYAELIAGPDQSARGRVDKALGQPAALAASAS